MDFSQLFSAEAMDQNVLPFVLGVGAKGVRFVLVIAAAAIMAGLLSRVMGRLLDRILRVNSEDGRVEAMEEGKRAATLKNVAGRATKIAVWSVAAVMALSEVGFEVAPLLASAGVAGVAIGFGAQSLVKDFLAGFFFLIENQIRVGDVAVINGQGGLIEEINLRTTILRDFSGDVHVIPNGSINQLANRTREFSFAVFDIGVSYREDVDHVMRVIGEVGVDLQADEVFSDTILEEMQILGVDKFADSAVVIKARIKTVPMEQWNVGRAFNRRLKFRFDEEGIEIPFPQRMLTLRHEESQDALRQIIREEIEKAQPAKLADRASESDG